MLMIDAKFWGVVIMGGAVVILFFLPWLDHSDMNLRQRILQRRVIAAEDPSLDREALRVHGQGTMLGSRARRQSNELRL